jgi:hypothetical protein
MLSRPRNDVPNLVETLHEGTQRLTRFLLDDVEARLYAT